MHRKQQKWETNVNVKNSEVVVKSILFGYYLYTACMIYKNKPFSGDNYDQMIGTENRTFTKKSTVIGTSQVNLTALSQTQSLYFLLRLDTNLNLYLCSFSFDMWCAIHRQSHGAFLPLFLPVSSWQRHFLSDWQVFCIVTLKKSPLNSTKSDTLSPPGQTWSTLTQDSSHSLWSWAGVGPKKPSDPFPSLTVNSLLLQGCDWPHFSHPSFSFLQQVKNALKYTIGFAIVCAVLLLIG